MQGSIYSILFYRMNKETNRAFGSGGREAGNQAGPGS